MVLADDFQNILHGQAGIGFEGVAPGYAFIWDNAFFAWWHSRTLLFAAKGFLLLFVIKIG